MSVKIAGAATNQDLEVDLTSKAARVTLYRSDGSEISNIPTAYLLPIPMLRLTAAIAAASKIWAMRNGTSKMMRIKRLALFVGFDGTAAATTSCYQLMRFAGATPSGGTALSAVKKKSSLGASTMMDARYNYGAALTVTGITFETSCLEIGAQRQVNANNGMGLFADLEGPDSIIELAPNEGLAINLFVASVIGDSIGGYIEWEEI